MKDFMSLYQNLVERCFTSCCNDFTSKALSSKEVRLGLLSLAPPPSNGQAHLSPLAQQEFCVNTCADKFLKHSERSVPFPRPSPRGAPH